MNNMNQEEHEKSLKQEAFFLIKTWLLVFIFIGAVVTIVQLWGTEIPIKYYPWVFFKAITHPIFVVFFLVVVGAPILFAFLLEWRKSRRRKIEKGSD